MGNVVEQIRMNGSFIKKDPSTGLFFDADDFMIRDKISQAFRNSLNQKKRSISPKNRKIYVLTPENVAFLNSKESKNHSTSAKASESLLKVQKQPCDSFQKFIE